MENEYLGSEDLRNTSMDDVLEHHGVLGMKWGVRNADTLRKYGGGIKTRIERKVNFQDRAKTRVAKSGKEIEPVSKRQVYRENTERGETDKPNQAEKKQLSYRDVKNPKDLTDEQLSALNDRMQKEINFNKRKAELNEMYKSKGEKRRDKFVADASEIGRDVIKKVVKKKLEDRLLGKNDSDDKSKKDESDKDKNSNKTDDDSKQTSSNQSTSSSGSSTQSNQTTGSQTKSANSSSSSSSTKRGPINVDAKVEDVNTKSGSTTKQSNLSQVQPLSLPEARMITKKVSKATRPVQNAIRKTVSETKYKQSDSNVDYSRVEKYLPVGADYVASNRNTPLSFIYDKKK